MKYLILLISIVTLSSCSNDVGRYEFIEPKSGPLRGATYLFDPKTGAIYKPINIDLSKEYNRDPFYPHLRYDWEKVASGLDRYEKEK